MHMSAVGMLVSLSVCVTVCMCVTVPVYVLKLCWCTYILAIQCVYLVCSCAMQLT